MYLDSLLPPSPTFHLLSFLYFLVSSTFYPKFLISTLRPPTFQYVTCTRMSYVLITEYRALRNLHILEFLLPSTIYFPLPSTSKPLPATFYHPTSRSSASYMSMSYLIPITFCLQPPASSDEISIIKSNRFISFR